MVINLIMRKIEIDWLNTIVLPWEQNKEQSYFCDDFYKNLFKKFFNESLNINIF